MSTKKETRRRFRHLTQGDRDRIEALYDVGEPQKEIAKILEVSPGTISRELRRLKRCTRYRATSAQCNADRKRRNSKWKGMKIEADPALRRHVIAELKKRQSPDAIAGRSKKDNRPFRIGKDAIYAWLYTGRGARYAKYLCTKRHTKKRQKKKPKREMIPNRIPLERRSKRNGLRHAEGDTFVSGKRAHTTAAGAMIVVPEAQFMQARNLPDLKPSSMVAAVADIAAVVEMDDLTLDNGIENRNHAQFPVPAYFCAAHHPWEKPHVENAIGLLRRWFLPKGTDLSQVTQKRLNGYVEVLNGKYRKSLGYCSPLEVARERGILKS